MVTEASASENASYMNTSSDQEYVTKKMVDLSSDESSKIVTHMDPHLYKAAAQGNIEPFKEVANRQLDSIVTPKKNTILHIHILSPRRFQKSTDFVEQMLDLCPTLLLQVNAKGDSPLHVAAQCGFSAIVEVIIRRAESKYYVLNLQGGERVSRQMLRMTNNEGNTAMHQAVRNSSLSVVKTLTKEDPDFSYCGNGFGESPLYIAVIRGNLDIVCHILEACHSAAHQGPDGFTALHAAVMMNHLGVTRKILEKKKSLTKETDSNGWTPLHYAAYYGHFSIVEELLKVDGSAAYIADKRRQMTALHLAAGQGHAKIMKEIIFHCPDCYELVDNRGWNALHFAMVSLSVEELNSFLENSLLGNLMDEKDVKGNTPLHVLLASHPDSFFDIKTEVRGDHFALYKQTKSFPQLFSTGLNEIKQEILELSTEVDTGPYRRGVTCKRERVDAESLSKEKARDSHLSVAALIATLTFLAAITLPPGGYKNREYPYQETATILYGNPFFNIFIITNTIALVLSLCAVFLRVIVSTMFEKKLVLLKIASFFTMFAMALMTIAFYAVALAVLPPSLGYACAILFGVMSFVLLLSYLMYKTEFMFDSRSGF